MIASTFTITRGCSLLRLQFILFHHRGHHRLLTLTSPSKVPEPIEPQACWFPYKRETHRTAWRQAMSAGLEGFLLVHVKGAALKILLNWLRRSTSLIELSARLLGCGSAAGQQPARNGAQLPRWTCSPLI